MPSASPSSRTTVQKNVQAPVRHGGPWSPGIPSQQELQFHTQSITQNALDVTSRGLFGKGSFTWNPS
ncbi:hypothetical protein quinque_009392 [Culex quinquefasciatus]